MTVETGLDVSDEVKRLDPFGSVADKPARSGCSLSGGVIVATLGRDSGSEGVTSRELSNRGGGLERDSGCRSVSAVRSGSEPRVAGVGPKVRDSWSVGLESRGASPVAGRSMSRGSGPAAIALPAGSAGCSGSVTVLCTLASAIHVSARDQVPFARAPTHAAASDATAAARVPIHVGGISSIRRTTSHNRCRVVGRQGAHRHTAATTSATGTAASPFCHRRPVSHIQAAKSSGVLIETSRPPPRPARRRALSPWGPADPAAPAAARSRPRRTSPTA